MNKFILKHHKVFILSILYILIDILFDIKMFTESGLKYNYLIYCLCLTIGLNINEIFVFNKIHKKENNLKIK